VAVYLKIQNTKSFPRAQSSSIIRKRFLSQTPRSSQISGLILVPPLILRPPLSVVPVKDSRGLRSPNALGLLSFERSRVHSLGLVSTLVGLHPRSVPVAVVHSSFHFAPPRLSLCPKKGSFFICFSFEKCSKVALFSDFSCKRMFFFFVF